jgi:hypothetical protein
VGFENILAQAAGANISPKIRADLSRLLQEQGDAPPVQMSSLLALSSAPEGAARPDETEALTGVVMPGAPRSGTGMPGIGWEQKAEPAAAASKSIGFRDTAGGNMALDLLEKRKKLRWWTPDFMANRNERDLDTALKLAHAEMSGSQAQSGEAQSYAKLLDERTQRDQSQTRWQAQASAEAAEREAANKRFQENLELDRKRFAESVRNNNSSDSDRDASRAFQEKVFAANQAAAATKQSPTSQYDLGAADPASTGVFAKFAETLRKGDPMATGEDVSAAQVDASRGGGLPPMMSSPANRPRVAVNPKTKKRFYVYANGRVSPAP